MLEKWKLMEQIRVGKKTFKNRIVMAPLETRLSNPDGSSTNEMVHYYAERAKGGAGAIIVENTFVDDKASRSSLVSSGLCSDHQIASKFLVAEAIKMNGAVAILQLSHGGRQAKEGATDLPCVAPSDVMCKVTLRQPHVLTVDEIVEIEDAFAKAAARAQMAGFDGIEIHGAHGYLICSFLSPYTNKRNDEYGGSPEKREHFPRNIIRKIRESVGNDFIVGYRISGAEFVDGGLTIEDTTAFVKTIEDQIDYIHVSAGNYETMAEWMITPMYITQAPIVNLAKEMKKAVNIPVITVGALNAELGEKALQDGSADLVAFGRALLADPYLPQKVKENRTEDIRSCCRGHEGCISLFFAGCPIRCEINPQVGREKEYKIYKTNNPKSIVIIGGGVAGMEAARVAGLYGHKVTLIEKTDTLGGHFLEATKPSFKQEGNRTLKWLIRQVKESDVKIIMNKQADTEFVKSLNPDAVIVAVGSRYMRIPIEGIDKTFTPDIVLNDVNKAGDKVAIIGGGLIGTETALHLAENGRKVEIFEMLPDIAGNEEPLSQITVKMRLSAFGVKIHTSCKVLSVQEGSLKYQDADGKEYTANADTVVSATGLLAAKDQASCFEDVASDVYMIGDCNAGGKIFECFHEAWHAVRCITGVE